MNLRHAEFVRILSPALRAIWMGGQSYIPQGLAKEPEAVYVVRYLDEDRGWTNLPVRAANEDEARDQVQGQVASVHKLP